MHGHALGPSFAKSSHKRETVCRPAGGAPHLSDLVNMAQAGKLIRHLLPLRSCGKHRNTISFLSVPNGLASDAYDMWAVKAYTLGRLTSTHVTPMPREMHLDVWDRMR